MAVNRIQEWEFAWDAEVEEIKWDKVLLNTGWFNGCVLSYGDLII